MVAEVIGGLLTNSLALLADAGHMLTDAGALALALLAVRFAGRPATPKHTYGFYRSEILAALVNAVVLLLVSFYILYEAWKRFQAPPEVLSWPMLIVAGIGLIVNLISMRLLASGSTASLNVKGAYLEVLGDVLGSLGVIAAGLIMLLTGWYLADPIVSAGIGLFIIPRTWGVLKDAVNILLEGAPADLDMSALERAMKSVGGVADVHHLHAWTITSGVDAMSGHVVLAEGADSDRVLAVLQKRLEQEFHIGHSTLQLEGKRPEVEGPTMI
jgi:cobalt-zinc-cadmium efflux system protein